MGQSVAWSDIRERWKDYVSQIKAWWQDLTDDDIAIIAGDRQQLVTHIQGRDDVLMSAARKEVDQWQENVRTYGAP